MFGRNETASGINTRINRPVRPIQASSADFNPGPRMIAGNCFPTTPPPLPLPGSCLVFSAELCECLSTFVRRTCEHFVLFGSSVDTGRSLQDGLSAAAAAATRAVLPSPLIFLLLMNCTAA